MAKTDQDVSPLSNFTQRQRVTLSRQITFAFIAFMLVVIRASPLVIDTAFLLGCGICVLAIVPTALWARHMKYSYPLFEIFMATNLTSYGVPLIWEQSADAFTESIRTSAAITVILFQVVAMAVFYGFRLRAKHAPFWDNPIFAQPSPKWLHIAMALTTGYLIVTTYFWYPSAEIVGVLRAVGIGLATAATFILCFMWGRGELELGDKLLLVLMMTVQFAIWSTSLVLRQGASLILLGLVGYFFGRRRVPWLAIALCVSLFAFLNLGKYTMRARYWFNDSQPMPSGVSGMASFYTQWFEAGLHPQAKQEDTSRTGLLVERNSLIQMLYLVMTMSPDPKPFLNGETYWQTFEQLVPHFLWPNKPRGHQSTYTLSIYYGLQDEEATNSTTIAFGFIPEAYANFGYLGVAAIAALFGLAFKYCAVRSATSPLLSYGGIAVVMLAAWSYQTELTMSIWVTSLMQALVSTVGAIWVPRKFMRME